MAKRYIAPTSKLNPETKDPQVKVAKAGSIGKHTRIQTTMRSNIIRRKV